MGLFGRRSSSEDAPRESRSEPEVTATHVTTVPKVPRRRQPAMGKALARLYDAGQQDRLTGSWGTTPLSADDVVRRNHRSLVARSREQAANNDYARKFLQMNRQNVVGPRGIQLQAQARDTDGTLDTRANEAIEAAWREWSRPENCDVTRTQSLRALQNGAIMGAARDGEFMIRIVTGRDAGAWGVGLQVLDPQRCPSDYDEVRLRNGRFIRHGIEFNRFGRPLAYHFTTTRAEADADAYSHHGRSYARIPADEIIHGFLPDMVGQKRGLPWTATALWRLQMLGGFEKAALVNARVAASKGGFFQWRDGEGPEKDDEDEEVYMEAEPGAFQELPSGVEFKEWNPQYPSNEFGPFHKAMLRGIASGLEVTYVNLANDLEGVNFSSIRQGTLDEREHWKELQEWLVETMMQRIYDAWLPRVLLTGRIRVNGRPLRADRIEKYRNIEWQPRRWDWIDPNADVKAAVASKNNLLASPGQIIRDRGRDPNSVWQEIGRDIESMRAAGIPDEYIQIALGMVIPSRDEAQAGRPPEGADTGGDG